MALRTSKTLPAPGPIALLAADRADDPDVLAIREEGGNNRGRWVAVILAAAGLAVGNPWCLAFVILRLKKAAEALGLELPAWIPITGYTPTFVAAARRQGLAFTVRQVMRGEARALRGDLLFFYGRVGGVWRIKHVEIIIGTYDGGFLTVGGNTGPEPVRGQVNRDGDGVYKKRRDYAEAGNPDKAFVVRLPC